MLADEPELLAIADALVETQGEGRVREIEPEHGARRRKGTVIRIAVATGVVALGAASGVAFLGGQDGATTANAAVLQHARSTVAPSGTMILYEKAVGTLNGTQVDYESWQLSSSPYSYRVIKGPTEAAYDGSKGTLSEYDAASNTITEITGQTTSQPQQFEDPVTELRQLLANGDAHIIGQTTIDGRDVYEISSQSGDALLNGTVYVDASTYAPVRVQLAPDPFCHDCVGPETINFLAYQQLPPTADNLQLVSLTAQHPQAQVITTTGRTSTDTTPTTTEPKSSTQK